MYRAVKAGNAGRGNNGRGRSNQPSNSRSKATLHKPFVVYQLQSESLSADIDQLGVTQQQQAEDARGPAAHLSIHHIILVIDVTREVGGHELILIPAPSSSSANAPLVKLANSGQKKLTITSGNYSTRQAVASSVHAQ